MQRSTKAGVLQMKTRKIQKKNLLQAICSNQLGYIHKQFEDLEETNTENVNEQWAQTKFTMLVLVATVACVNCPSPLNQPLEQNT